MNGELNIGQLKSINIQKTGLEYDMAIVSEDGTLHLCSMRDLPYYLIKALGSITEFPQIYHNNDIHLGSIREEIENGR